MPAGFQSQTGRRVELAGRRGRRRQAVRKTDGQERGHQISGDRLTEWQTGKRYGIVTENNRQKSRIDCYTYIPILQLFFFNGHKNVQKGSGSGRIMDPWIRIGIHWDEHSRPLLPSSGSRSPLAALPLHFPCPPPPSSSGSPMQPFPCPPPPAPPPPPPRDLEQSLQIGIQIVLMLTVNVYTDQIRIKPPERLHNFIYNTLSGICIKGASV